MKNRNFLKTILKKKKNRIIAAAICFTLGTAVLVVSLRINSVRAQDAAASVIQNASVTKGSISNTIDANGNLEAAETTDVTVPTGVRSETIKVDTGEEVTKGQTLATLNKTSVTRLLINVRDELDAIGDELDSSSLTSLEKEELEGKKEELEQMEKKLVSLYKKPALKAPSDGIVGAINISENTKTTDSTGNTSSDSAGQGSSLSQMSAESTHEDPGLLFLTADTSTDAALSEVSGDAEAADGAETAEQEDSSDKTADLKTVSDYSALSIKAPVTGETPQKTVQETAMYKGSISWDCSGSTFQGETVYTATIVLTAKSGYTFSEKNLPIIADASFHWSIHDSGEENKLKIVAKYEKTSEAQGSSANAGAGNAADTDSKDSGSSSGTDGSTTDPGSQSSPADKNSGSQSSSGKSGSAAGAGSSAGSSGSAGSSSSTGSSSGTSAEDAGAYETVAFTLASQDDAKITVNVDELDILSVEKEQSASVTLDALEDETFTGTVTKISSTAAAGSGSTKYEVEITVPMDERMRIGMSASAAIQVSSAEDTLILPMTALQQKGDETFVYTAKNADGNLSGEVTVETGLSDGQNVEISGGLEEGTEVYYTRASKEEKSLEKETGFPGIMNGSGAPDTPPGNDHKRQDSDNSRGGGTFPGGGPSGD